MRTGVLLPVLLLGCAAKAEASKLEPGGCTLIKQAPTGEYPIGQLTKFAGDQQDVCQHMVDAWNADKFLTGTSSRFRCGCPPPK